MTGDMKVLSLWWMTYCEGIDRDYTHRLAAGAAEYGADRYSAIATDDVLPRAVDYYNYVYGE